MDAAPASADLPRLRVPLYVNTRILAKRLTGVQRYLTETLERLPLRYKTCAPRRHADGAAGHLWEQTLLPLQTRDGLLWSPSHSGPLRVRRQVVTIHDTLSFDYPELVGSGFARWYRFLVPRVGRRAQWVITVSQFSRQRLQELGVVNDNVSVIYPGVSAAFGSATEEHAKAAAAELRLPTREYVLTLSSLARNKNLRRLLDAWRLLAPRLPREFWLVLAGASGDARIYGDTALGPLPPRTFFTGFVPERFLPGLYRGARAFAFPSLYEGFGFPVVEAMSAGVPTLIGNRTSLPEVAGDAAVAVDPENTGAVASGLERVLLDDPLRDRLRVAGRTRVREFTWERCAQQTAELLLRVANG